MLKTLKKVAFALILTTTPLQLLLGGLNNGVESNQVCVVTENGVNPKIKLFINWAKEVFSKYKENPEEIENRLEKANSDCSSYIIDSCNKYQFFELTKFKLKNKKLLVKLGYILLNSIAEIKDISAQDLNLSNEEFTELQNIIENFAKRIPDEIRTITRANETLAPAKSEKIKAIMQKLNLALNHLSKHDLGLKNSILSPMNEKLKLALNCLLSEAELKELHTFITKEKGAFDKIVEEIDAIWEIAVKCLS